MPYRIQQEWPWKGENFVGNHTNLKEIKEGNLGLTHSKGWKHFIKITPNIYWVPYTHYTSGKPKTSLCGRSNNSRLLVITYDRPKVDCPHCLRKLIENDKDENGRYNK